MWTGSELVADIALALNTLSVLQPDLLSSIIQENCPVVQLSTPKKNCPQPCLGDPRASVWRCGSRAVSRLAPASRPSSLIPAPPLTNPTPSAPRPAPLPSGPPPNGPPPSAPRPQPWTGEAPPPARAPPHRAPPSPPGRSAGQRDEPGVRRPPLLLQRSSSGSRAGSWDRAAP